MKVTNLSCKLKGEVQGEYLEKYRVGAQPPDNYRGTQRNLKEQKSNLFFLPRVSRLAALKFVYYFG